MIPDLAFVKKNRLPVRFTGPIPVAPDLIAEVNSPTDTLRKMRTKIQAHQEAGVRMVWSIYMDDQFVLVYDFVNATRRFLDLTDELDGGEVIPGFKLPVARFFE